MCIVSTFVLISLIMLFSIIMINICNIKCIIRNPLSGV